MRFFTDRYYSDEQKAKLLENAFLVEHPSVRLGEKEIQSHRQELVFYVEWQQEEPQASEPDSMMAPPMDLSAVLVMMLVGVFGGLFMFDVLIG